MRRIGEYGQENYKLMEDFKSWASENNLLDDNSIIYGIVRDDVKKIEPQNCRYDIGMAIELGTTCKDKINDLEVKKAIFALDGQYLIFKIEHTAEAVSEFWSNVFAILEKENFRIDIEKPILERYSMHLVRDGFCEMCVPFNK